MWPSRAHRPCPMTAALGVGSPGGWRGNEHRRLSWPGMASIELDGPDALACPLLGLAADRRSHFTYAHPGHRCFATEHPATTNARRQATYCLSPGYTACDRYQARQRPAQAGEGPEPGAGLRANGGEIGPVDGPERRGR